MYAQPKKRRRLPLSKIPGWRKTMQPSEAFSNLASNLCQLEMERELYRVVGPNELRYMEWPVEYQAAKERKQGELGWLAEFYQTENS